MLPTLGLVLARHAGRRDAAPAAQGIATLLKAQAELAAGRTPARPLAEGAVKARRGAAHHRCPASSAISLGIALFIPSVRETAVAGDPSPGFACAPRHLAAAQHRAEPVIDLDRSEYGADALRAGRADTPWRLPDESRDVDCSPSARARRAPNLKSASQDG